MDPTAQRPKPIPAAPAVTPRTPRAAPILRPARQPEAPLPAAPPKAAPQVRIRIGALTIVTRNPHERPGAPRKTLLAKATRRAPRGHSIPRPDGG
ncbi:hypothetical protein [Paracoccus sp. MKU1]|uniref:hypothetical protein n=1 Tax=Paracoccus sp. MKU1 TaxID=1745182 RepID=UPI00128FB6AB|nr:hypothetical protein [Paracoccus sp. MKU1]